MDVLMYSVYVVWILALLLRVWCICWTYVPLGVFLTVNVDTSSAVLRVTTLSSSDVSSLSTFTHTHFVSSPAANVT